MKKIIKILLLVLFIIIVLIFFFFLGRFAMNEIIISNYEKEVYDSNLLKILEKINIDEKYVIYYNEGNILYKKEKYKEAEDKYRRALKEKIPKDRYCLVVDNLSLSIINQVTEDSNCDEMKKLYEKAKEELETSKCIIENDDSKILYVEINNYLIQLEETCKGGDSEEDDEDDSEDDGDDNGDSEDEDESDAEKERQKEIEERNKRAEEERSDSEERQGSFGNYYDGKTW